MKGLYVLIDYYRYSTDILAASKALSCPRFRFISQEDDINPTLQGLLCFGQTDLEDGFMRLCTIGFTEELAEVYQAMKTYISIIEKYQEGATSEPDMCKISNQRNLVQYHLLSLTPANQLGDQFRRNYPIYETCRLTGLIIGVGIIFPLPAHTAPLQMLVRCLQAELRAANFDAVFCSRDATGVLLWILTLGCIAATDMPEKVWFVVKLGRVAARLGLLKWQHAKRVLELMPWLDSACSSAGRKVWGAIDGSSASADN
jgi:hypothetical protein